MDIIREVNNFQKSNQPLFLALGNFDGLHRGHQELIRSLVNRAHLKEGRAAAFIFDPHPSTVLNPERAPRLLVTGARKAELLGHLGLQTLIYHTFDQTISHCSPEEFVRQMLLEKLGAAEVFVGFNYSFGYRGQGNPARLAELGKKYGFGVNITPPIEMEGEVVSSSLVRQALNVGDIYLASAMLGYHPMIEGQVIEGERRGHTIGFPTANLGVSPALSIPGKGVYAAWAQTRGGCYVAAVNIGQKPTFHQEFPVSVEAHIVDFDLDIYGQEVRLFFLQKIRDERRFDSLEALVRQIGKDREQAIAISRLHEKKFVPGLSF